MGIASPRWVPTAVTGRTAHRGPGSAPSPVTPPRPLSSAFESISQQQRPACGAGRRALPPASARPRRPTGLRRVHIFITEGNGQKEYFFFFLYLQ